MKKHFSVVAIFFTFLIPSHAGIVTDYFDNFYYNYLCAREIKTNGCEILNLLKNISNAKIVQLEKNLNAANSNEEINEAITLINEEYFDLFENLELEAGYISNCPLEKRRIKKFKRDEKKFIKSLYKLR